MLDFILINLALIAGLLIYNLVYQHFFIKRRNKLGHYRKKDRLFVKR